MTISDSLRGKSPGRVMCFEIVKQVIKLTLCFNLVAGFNLDSKVPILRTGVRGSYFGFSIAQHLKTEGNEQHVVLVGAPRDDGTSRQFVRTGAVFQCPLSVQNESCSRLDIDNYEIPGKEKENKTDQWLGVSVSSANSINGIAVTCAHRYRRTGPGNTGYVWGEGICFPLANDLADLGSPLEPCRDKPRGIGDDHQYLVCQVGTSSAVNKNGSISMGSPGPHTWKGAVFITDVLDQSGGVIENDNTTGIKTDSYLGMSVRIGDRIFRDGKPAYIVGAPRSRQSGEVFIFRENQKSLTVVQRILGPTFYSGFGYEILVGDFNGDTKDDVIVGAPFFYEPGLSGAIYIYFNTPEWELSSRPIRITSRKMKDQECKQLNCHDARFGFSLANAGDLNKDGVDDFVVGAPFEGNGAIYIFHGSSTSKIGSYSQRIAAGDVVGVQLKSFGYSLSGGGDIDGNSYPDLVVGSYQSDTITILRARPIVSITGNLESNPKQMDPKVTNCSDGKLVNCVRITVCLSMTGEPRDKFRQAVNVKYRLEAEKFTGASVVRVYFGDNPEMYFAENSVALQPHAARVCRDHTVYLRSNNKDFYNAIAFRLTYQLPDSRPPTATPSQGPPEFYSYPVLNDSTTSKELQVSFIKNCGTDDICTSSLKLSVNVQLPKEKGEYELNLEGESQLVVNASVTNSGEDAHATVLRVTLPPNVFLIRIVPKELSCIPVENILECELGNPVSEGQTVSIQIILNPNRLTNFQNRITIGFAVNTTSAETDTADDSLNVEIDVAFIVDLSVIGFSDPRSVYFSSADSDSQPNSPITHEEQIGPEILHTFEVRNIGSTVVSKSKLTITWPLVKTTTSSQPLYILYIMERPMVQGKSRELPGAPCKMDARYINPLDIKAKDSNPDSIQTLPQNQDNSNSRRKKRSTPEKSGLGNLICGKSSGIQCISIDCDVEELRYNERVRVTIRARLWNRTLAAHFSDESELLATSTAVVSSDAGPGSFNIRDRNSTNDVGQAATNVINSKSSEPVAIWIIVLAVFAGLLLLIIAIFILWKVGFFKRKKPEFYPEHRAAIVKSDANDEDNQEAKDIE